MKLGFFHLIVLSLLFSCACAIGAEAERGPPPAAWAEALTAEVAALDEKTEGNLGLYVKRLSDGAEVRYQAGRPWYLSSTVKVPVAVALLQKVEAGAAKLEEKLPLAETDFVDGSGSLRFQAIGSTHTLRSLLERMIRDSDSTATDMLIRRIGEGELNRRVRETMATNGFRPITTLLAVRTGAYSELHPRAVMLTNLDFLAIRAQDSREGRVEEFRERAGLNAGELNVTTLEAAFEKYYAKGLNSATLEGFGRLLENVATHKILKPAHAELLLGLMQEISTGANRLRAGFPKGVSFAQKTGTQIGRLCNVGVAWEKKRPANRVVIAACVEKFADTASAEATLARAGKLLAQYLWK